MFEDITLSDVERHTDWANLTNAWGKVQWLNLDGSSFQPNLITGVNVPADVAAGKMYWTESGTGRIQRANLTGGNIQTVVAGLDAPARIACGIALLPRQLPQHPLCRWCFPKRPIYL